VARPGTVPGAVSQSGYPTSSRAADRDADDLLTVNGDHGMVLPTGGDREGDLLVEQHVYSLIGGFFMVPTRSGLL
jgi:hypothetical protein